MRFTEFIPEDANPKRQAAIAIAIKKAGKKPKNEGYAMEDEQIDGMAQGEIREIIKNAVHIKNQLDKGVSLDGWMYSYVTTSNDHLNSVAEQINNPNIDEGDLDKFKKYTRPVVKTTPKIERTTNPSGRTTDHVEWLVTTPTGEIHRHKSKTAAQAQYDSFGQQEVDEGENWSKHNNKRVGGMSKKSVSSYRRSHPGSKIQTAVTTKPSKLKKGSKAAARRKSFCARMKGMKKHRTGAKTARDPNSNINKSLRRWHCESIEELNELVMIAEQFIRNKKNEL